MKTKAIARAIGTVVLGPPLSALLVNGYFKIMCLYFTEYTSLHLTGFMLGSAICTLIIVQFDHDLLGKFFRGEDVWRGE